jgi:hypothetical protein
MGFRSQTGKGGVGADQNLILDIGRTRDYIRQLQEGLGQTPETFNDPTGSFSDLQRLLGAESARAASLEEQLRQQEIAAPSGIEVGVDPETVLSVELDRGPLDALRAFAESDEPSDFLNLLLEDIQLKRSQILDDVREERLSGVQQAREALASRTGLRGGAEALLEQAGIESEMEAAQEIGRAATQDEISARLAEQEQKLNVQQLLPQLELQASEFERGTSSFNINTLINEINTQREIALERERLKMALEAARIQGEATEEAGKGGLLTTILKPIL